MLDGRGAELLGNPGYRLSVITARGIGPLAGTRGVKWREMAGFVRAAAGNAVSRGRLAGAMERVVFHDARDDAAWLRERFDGFASHFVGLSEANLRDALLASGSIPLVLEAVTVTAQALATHCAFDEKCTLLMQRASKRLSLSARGYHRVLRAARTIADLAGASSISQRHLAEAIGLRQLDRRTDGHAADLTLIR